MISLIVAFIVLLASVFMIGVAFGYMWGCNQDWEKKLKRWNINDFSLGFRIFKRINKQ